MAKEEMICPFSGQRCKNCAIYIGRHYYLCYCRNDRGYKGRGKTTNRPVTHRPLRASVKKNFKIPKIEARGLDPFETDLLRE